MPSACTCPCTPPLPSLALVGSAVGGFCRVIIMVRDFGLDGVETMNARPLHRTLQHADNHVGLIVGFVQRSVWPI